MKRHQRIVLIGPLPPPIGGVTIHLSRLLDKLKGKINFMFYPLTIGSLLMLPYLALTNKAIHIHTSNSFVQCYCMFICRILKATGIITIHRSLNRYQSLNKFWLRGAIKFADYPIVLNTESYRMSYSINSQTRLLPAFIEPNIQKEFLSQEDIARIRALRETSRYLLCTNGSTYALDTEGKEIYGIFEIIEMVRYRPSLGLIISDPSRTYLSELHRRSITLPQNTLLISQKHSFYRVLQLCDVCIRNTTTDGDSLSVKESLFLGKLTLATDAVDRPSGCYTYPYGKLDQVIDKILLDTQTQVTPQKTECGAAKLLELYNMCI